MKDMFSWFKKTLPISENASRAGSPPGPIETFVRQSPPSDESIACKRQGNEFLAQGRLPEAAESYRRAVSISPNYAEGYLNLGFVLHAQGLYDKAAPCLERAIELNPELADAHYMLGAIAEVRGNLDQAIKHFNRALELKPDFEIVYRDLCHVLFKSGHTDRSKQIISRGIALNPKNAEFHSYLGNLYLHDNRLEDAIACYRRALVIQPDIAGVYSNMGKAYLELGRADEARNWYRKACSLDGDSVNSDSLSALLFIQSYDADCSPTQYLSQAREFGAMVMARAKPYTDWVVDPAGSSVQPLRVGLVSGDFRNHPVGFFLENILAHLNPGRIRMVAYSTQSQEDDLTTRIKPLFAAWNCIADSSDEAVARKIYEDGIHILIDLAGHSAHNRLPVFAWRPAPVQASWLGYWASTGVPTMDYVLADTVSVPEAHRAHFTETMWYLPNTRLCFTPPAAADRQPVAALPALRNGHVTFGCFQNATKINDDVLLLWGKILDALPQARLRIQNKQMDYGQTREQIQRRLAQAGIGAERVTMVGRLARMDYLAAHAEVDVILDTFPYPGGTTTCEALWMGVPTVTLLGDTLLSRQGASLLACAGLADWVAKDKEEYVAITLTRVAEIDRLVQLRAGLRQQVLASPLFDGPRFAKHLEGALEGMWHQSQKHVLLRDHV